MGDGRREGLTLNVELSRSGGFAGITRTASADTDDLPADLHARLQALLDAGGSGEPAPDRFVYTLRCGDREVTLGESALDGDDKRLMAWLLGRR